MVIDLREVVVPIAKMYLSKNTSTEIVKSIIDINIRDQLYLLSLLIIFVGIVSTDTYYQAFNVKYQTLNLPASHIVIRGMTAVFTNWYILLSYAVAALWLVYQKAIVLVVSRKLLLFAGILPYLFISAVIAANYPLASFAGKTMANIDMQSDTSRLPRIISISRKSCTTSNSDCSYSGARMLVYDGSYLIVFWPLEKGSGSELINIHRIAKEDANVIKTCVK
jgi:hypothetical protein